MIPSETEAPLLQASFDDAICTFQSPSKVDAAAGVAVTSAASRRRRVVENDLRKYLMMGPRVLMGARSHIASDSTVMIITWGQPKAPALEARAFKAGASQRTTAQFTRVQVWPPQNIAPKAQPWTRGHSLGAFQGDHKIVVAAGVRIEIRPLHFVLAGLHVDQNLLTVLVRFGVDGIAAEIDAALFDPDFSLFLFRQPHAERRIG